MNLTVESYCVVRLSLHLPRIILHVSHSEDVHASVWEMITVSSHSGPVICGSWQLFMLHEYWLVLLAAKK